MTAKEQIQTLAERLHRDYPDAYPTIEQARTKARSLNPELRQQEARELAEDNARAREHKATPTRANPYTDAVQAIARRMMAEDPERYPTIEKARVAAREASPALRDEESFRENPRLRRFGEGVPESPPRNVAAEKIQQFAEELQREHPLEKISIEKARSRVRELHPALAAAERSNASKADVLALTESKRFADPDDVRDKLRDGEREAKREQGRRRQAVLALVAEFAPEIRERMERGELDVDEGVTEFFDNVLKPALVRELEHKKRSKPRERKATPAAIAAELKQEGVRGASEGAISRVLGRLFSRAS